MGAARALISRRRLVLQQPIDLGLLTEVVNFFNVFYGMLNLVRLVRPQATALGLLSGLHGVQVAPLIVKVLLIFEPLVI